MAKTSRGPQDGNLLEVIEGLLDLFVDREEEIAKLTQELSDLRCEHENHSKAHTGPGKKFNGHPGQPGILVVDDSEIMRTRIVKLLRCNGYRIVGEAENGEKAIQQYNKRHPEVTIMDLEMPVMNGLEATEQLKKIDPDVKIVIISQALDRNLVLNALNAGAVDFLLKPVQLDRLLQLIDRLVGPSSLAAEMQALR
jgi:two-component system, chemotaxis family, chemotaxis protein CheY